VPFWRAHRSRPPRLERWQRDQYLVVLTVALVQIAQDLSQPFFPLYVRELGITDLSEAAFWAGWVSGIASLTSAVTGPFWGAMADRFGRKAMVLRALIMISIIQFIMAFVPNVQSLVAARFMLGAFAGFTPMAMALAISIAPRERMAQAIGLVQAAGFLPTAIGPTIGGVIADTFGLRVNFVVTSVILFVPAMLLFFLVDESTYTTPRDRTSPEPARGRGAMLSLLAMPGFITALAILFMTRFTDRTTPPILPLFLIEVDTPSAQLATITGFVVSSGAVAAGVSSMLYGRWARPESTRRLLLLALAGGAICSIFFALVDDWISITVLCVILGLLAGGGISLAFTYGVRLAPPERSAATLSMLSSGGQLGSASAPILAGMIGGVGLRYVFIANALAYALAAILAALPSRGRAWSPNPDPAAET
jgi:DHA1 family multidrug resistance protein-like MFS transporter